MIEWMLICWLFFLFKCTLNSQEPFWLSYIVKHFLGIWCIMMLGFETLRCWDLRHYDVGIWGITMLGFEALRCWDLRHYDVGIWGITMLAFFFARSLVFYVMFCISLFAPFLLVIVLSGLCQIMASEYPLISSDFSNSKLNEN
jgi:hypothetical protein